MEEKMVMKSAGLEHSLIKEVRYKEHVLTIENPPGSGGTRKHQR